MMENDLKIVFCDFSFSVQKQLFKLIIFCYNNCHFPLKKYSEELLIKYDL